MTECDRDKCLSHPVPEETKLDIVLKRLSVYGFNRPDTNADQYTQTHTHANTHLTDRECLHVCVCVGVML